MNRSIHSWDSPSVNTYQQSIRQKIIGYDLIYDMMASILHNFTAANKFLVVGTGITHIRQILSFCPFHSSRYLKGNAGSGC